MKERDWYSAYVRPALHRPAEGCVCWKTQDAFRKGMPDAVMCARGEVMQLEMKFADALTGRAGDRPFNIGLSAEQRILLDEWYQSGGRSAVLLGLGDGRALFIGWNAIELPKAELISGSLTLRWKGNGPEQKLSILPRLLAAGALDARTSRLEP